MKYIRETERVPLGFFTGLEEEVRKFAEKNYPDYVCYIDEIEEDSSSLRAHFGERTDIWLYFAKYGKTEQCIKDGFRQKVFLIKGNLFDCAGYRKFLEEMEAQT